MNFIDYAIEGARLTLRNGLRATVSVVDPTDKSGDNIGGYVDGYSEDLQWWWCDGSWRKPGTQDEFDIIEMFCNGQKVEPAPLVHDEVDKTVPPLAPPFIDRIRLRLFNTAKPISIRMASGRIGSITTTTDKYINGKSDIPGNYLRWNAAGKHDPIQGQHEADYDIVAVVTDEPVAEWSNPHSLNHLGTTMNNVPEWAPTLEPAGVPWATNGEIVDHKFTPMTHNLKGNPLAEAVVKAQQPVKTSMGANMFSIEEMFEAAKASQPVPVARVKMGLKQCTLEELNAGDVVILENGIEANIVERRLVSGIVRFVGMIDPVPGSGNEPLRVVWAGNGGAWLSTTELGDTKFTAPIKTCFKRVQLAPPMPTGGAECDVDWLSIIDGYPDVAYHDVVATLRNGHKIKVKVNPDEPVGQFPIERAEGCENKSWTRYGRVYQGEASAYDITDINLVQRTVEEPTFNRAQKIEAVARRLAQVDGYEPEALTILGTPMQAIPGVVLVTGRAGLVPVWERYVERATSLVDLIVQSEMQKL